MNDARPIYVIRVQALPDVDAVRALRAALKVLFRRFGLKAIEVKTDPAPVLRAASSGAPALVASGAPTDQTEVGA